MAHSQEKKQLKIAAGRVMARFMHSSLCAAMDTWKDSVDTICALRILMQRIACRFRSIRLASAFHGWFDAIKDFLRQKVLCSRILKK